MKFAKRLLMVAGAVALAGLLSVMMAPRAVHALVSTLVTVANTSSNSIPINDGGFAEEPFEWTGVTVSGSTSSTFTAPSVTADGRTVRRLVIEDITADCSGLSSSTPGIAVEPGGSSTSFSAAGSTLFSDTTAGIQFFIPFAPAIGSEQDLSQTTRIYVDAGTSVSFFYLQVTGGGTCTFSALGHLVVQ